MSQSTTPLYTASISRNGGVCYFPGALRVLRALIVVSIGLLSLAGVGCSSEAKLRREGRTPYVRCLGGPEPEERTLRIGELSLQFEKRVLSVTGPARALRVAAFSAAGFGGPPSAAALDRLRQSRPDLILMLGGVGDRTELASATFAKLASLEAATLVVLGGRDGWTAHEKALDGLEHNVRIIDATVLRAVRIGKNTFVPLAGAEAGRYSLHETACGFDASDLDAASKDLGRAEPGETRWLLSWQGPSELPSAAGSGPAAGPRTSTGQLLGSPAVARFARSIAARGALYAWPNDQARPPMPADGEPLSVAAVPRLYGPRLEVGDGARAANGLLTFEVGRDGVRIAR